jgi:hypothetical protein
MAGTHQQGTPRGIAAPGRSPEPSRTLKSLSAQLGDDTLIGLVAQLERSSASRAVRADVHVIGTPGAGCSSLIDALVGASICTSEALMAADPATVVRIEDHPHVTIEALTTNGVTVAQHEAAESLLASPIEHVRAVRVGVPQPFLALGFAISDIGTGGRVTLADLGGADATILCVDVTDPRLPALDAAAPAPSIVALTRCDLVASDERIARATAELRERFPSATVVATSAPLRIHALTAGDSAANERSGYREIVVALRGLLGGAGDRRQQRLAVAAIERLDRIAARLDDAPSVEVAGVHLSNAELTASRWNQQLSDGFTDLIADAEHALKLELRDIIRRNELRLDNDDPARDWPAWRAAIVDDTRAAVVRTFAMLHVRVATMAGGLAAPLGLNPADLAAAVDVRLPRHELDALADPEMQTPNAGSRVGLGLSALRSTTGGFVMIGVTAKMTNLDFAAPILLGAGVALGGKAFVDERRRARQQRRLQTRSEIKRYMDEVQLLVGKSCRDQLRRIQRSLRDTCSAASKSQVAQAKDGVRAARQQEQDRQRRDEVIGHLRMALAEVAS